MTQTQSRVEVAQVSKLLSELISAGGLRLSANFECAPGVRTCLINETWTFHGAEIKPDSFCFVAAKSGHPPIRFQVRNEYKEAFFRWLAKIKDSIVKGVETAVAATIVFLAGVIDVAQTPKLVLPAAA
jgi:hypothetical protein